jgi:hypothetical protein
LTLGSEIRDPGWRKIRIRNPVSGMNIPDHISESLGYNFFFKNIKFFDADPDLTPEIFSTLDQGSGMKQFGSGIRDKHPGSATLLYRRENNA